MGTEVSGSDVGFLGDTTEDGGSLLETPKNSKCILS